MSARAALAVLGIGLLVAACQVPGPINGPLTAPEPPWVESIRGDGPGTAARAAAASVVPVGSLERSRRGNASSYVVFGERYEVQSDATGYRAEGVASWYGRKFHGRETASGEVYDMHELTAAHRSLPLPTLVRVTHLDNERSIVVRVNDRGPFVDDRLIDLSYAAAMKLDMLATGTAPVRVEALEPAEIAALSGREVEPRSSVAEPDSSESAPDGAGQGWFVNAGAFRERPNAERQLARIVDILDREAELLASESAIPWRIRVGPFADAEAGRQAVARLARYGVDAYLASTP